MVEFFKNKDKHYIIDSDASVKNLVSPKFLLMYIANLGLHCDIDNITPELILEYMKLKEFTNIANLQYTHANILNLAKHGEMLYSEDAGLMPMDECIEVAKNNNELLIHQLALINSIPLYILTRLGASEDEPFGPLYDTVITHKTNDQFDDIGYSVIKLFSIPDFLLSFLSTNIPIEDQIYFTRYFDEYMFNGSNIFSYIFNNKNAYAGLCQLLSDVEAGNEESQAIMSTLIANMTDSINNH